MKQPTRVTYGINTFPKASPSHCKLEAFLPPYGWVSFDVSETQKLAAAIRADGKLSESEKSALVQQAHERLVSGFRDNTWFKQTQGPTMIWCPRPRARWLWCGRSMPRRTANRSRTLIRPIPARRSLRG